MTLPLFDWADADEPTTPVSVCYGHLLAPVSLSIGFVNILQRVVRILGCFVVVHFDARISANIRVANIRVGSFIAIFR